LAGVQFVPFRVREGDEASCLNLNRAQKPRVLGVNPELLARRFTFAKMEKVATWEPWEMLRRSTDGNTPSSHSTLNSQTSILNPDEIPAIGDANSIQWA